MRGAGALGLTGQSEKKRSSGRSEIVHITCRRREAGPGMAVTYGCVLNIVKQHGERGQ